MRTKSDNWDKDFSPVDWYVANILVRFEYYDEDKSNLNRRCKAWENLILIKAASLEEAYEKALEHGKLHEAGEAWDEDTGRKGRWKFEGLTSLLPIYNELEDGAEITWKQYTNRTVKKVTSWASPKNQLEVFNSD
ncbi:MAG TPA: DUF4288 domain-containing protein [Abditibacteriaceae bacterium]|jgi:hypothetical protein